MVLCCSECYPALSATLRDLMPVHVRGEAPAPGLHALGGSGHHPCDSREEDEADVGVVACKDCVVCYIGYESRMEHEDAFFEALQVRSLASCHGMVPSDSRFGVHATAGLPCVVV